MYRPCSKVVSQRYEASAGQRSSSRKRLGVEHAHAGRRSRDRALADREQDAAIGPTRRASVPTALADAARPSVQTGGVPPVGRSAQDDMSGRSPVIDRRPGLPPPALQQVERRTGYASVGSQVKATPLAESIRTCSGSPRAGSPSIGPRSRAAQRVVADLEGRRRSCTARPAAGHDVSRGRERDPRARLQPPFATRLGERRRRGHAPDRRAVQARRSRPGRSRTAAGRRRPLDARRDQGVAAVRGDPKGRWIHARTVDRSVVEAGSRSTEATTRAAREVDDVEADLPGRRGPDGPGEVGERAVRRGLEGHLGRAVRPAGRVEAVRPDVIVDLDRTRMSSSSETSSRECRVVRVVPEAPSTGRPSHPGAPA